MKSKLGRRVSILLQREFVGDGIIDQQTPRPWFPPEVLEPLVPPSIPLYCSEELLENG